MPQHKRIEAQMSLFTQYPKSNNIVFCPKKIINREKDEKVQWINDYFKKFGKNSKKKKKKRGKKYKKGKSRKKTKKKKKSKHSKKS